MQLKERTLQALGELNSIELSYIYETIQLVTNNRTLSASASARTEFFLQTQEALANCTGTLAQDIITERGDRI